MGRAALNASMPALPAGRAAPRNKKEETADFVTGVAMKEILHRLDFMFTSFGQILPMTKTLTADMQRKHAERQLFHARRALSHLIEMYESGQWRHLYKEDTFAEAVRQARQTVDHWTGMAAKSDSL